MWTLQTYPDTLLAWASPGGLRSAASRNFETRQKWVSIFLVKAAVFDSPGMVAEGGQPP